MYLVRMPEVGRRFSREGQAIKDFAEYSCVGSDHINGSMYSVSFGRPDQSAVFQRPGGGE